MKANCWRFFFSTYISFPEDFDHFVALRSLNPIPPSQPSLRKEEKVPVPDTTWRSTQQQSQCKQDTGSGNEIFFDCCRFVLHKILPGLPIVNSQSRISLLVRFLRFHKNQSSLFSDFFSISGKWIMSVSQIHRTQSIPWTTTALLEIVAHWSGSVGSREVQLERESENT